MRYIVREGSARGKGRHWRGCLDTWSPSDSRRAFTYRYRDLAESCADLYGGRVVRLLSHEEAKQKAIAEALRKIADKSHEVYPSGRDLHKIADAYWPRNQAHR